MEDARTKLEGLEDRLAEIVRETNDCEVRVQRKHRADPIQRKEAPASEQIKELEAELRDFDEQRKPLELAKSRVKRKHEDARRELKGLEVREVS